MKIIAGGRNKASVCSAVFATLGCTIFGASLAARAISRVCHRVCRWTTKDACILSQNELRRFVA